MESVLKKVKGLKLLIGGLLFLGIEALVISLCTDWGDQVLLPLALICSAGTNFLLYRCAKRVKAENEHNIGE